MSKSTITRLFFGGIVAVIAGWVLGIAAVLAAIAGGAIAIGGPTVVSVDGAALAAPLSVLVIAAALVGIGTLCVVVSWIGALVATARLDDKTWFVLLLVLGLWSFGVVAMVAYVIAGPDDRNQGATDVGIVPAPGA
jgi:hypothetical protein